MPTDETDKSARTPGSRIGRAAGGYATRHRDLHSGDPDFEGVTCPDCDSDDLEVVSLFAAR